VRLLAFIEAIEDCLGRKAIRNYMPMQMGDVPATWADVTLLERLTGHRQQTDYRDGIARFVTWFRDYYQKLKRETLTDMHSLDDLRIAVIGLGYVGLPLAVEFGKEAARRRLRHQGGADRATQG